MEPKNVLIKVTARFHREGSVIAGTAWTVWDGVTTELALDGDEPSERVAQLIKMSEASCYTMVALRSTVAVELVSTVNERAFDVGEAAPAS